jgi:hypothetical protein
MQIPGVIAQFDRIAYRTWLEAHPSLRGGANNDRTLAVDQKDGAVEQLLMARQRDRKFLAPVRRRQQPAPRQIGYGDIDQIHRAAVLEAVNLLRILGFQAAAQDTIDTQHRARPFQRLDVRGM